MSFNSGFWNFTLKDRLYRGQVERVWIMSNFDLRRFKAIPDLPSRIFLYSLTPSTISSPTLAQSSIHLLFSPLLKLRESMQGRAVLTRREVDDGVRTTLRSFLSSGLGWNGPKKYSTPTVNNLKRLNFKLMNKFFVFVRERGRCQ